jgi:hypothetical protein
MPYAVTSDSRVAVAFRCDLCAQTDRYRQQPACNIVRDALTDGWTVEGDDERVCLCPDCSAHQTEGGPNHNPAAWRRVLPDERWEDFPLGTFAQDHTGAWWVKTDGGWKAGAGDTFPSPGADALSVQLPAALADAARWRATLKAQLAAAALAEPLSGEGGDR